MTRRLAADFAREHLRRFGFVTEAALEVVQLVARVETRPLPMPRTPTARTKGGFAPRTRRAPLGSRAIRVLDRRHIPIGAEIPGPLVCEEATATTLVPAHWTLTATAYGTILRKAD